MLEWIADHQFIFFSIVLLTLIKLYNMLTTGKITNTNRLDGKTVLITGANAGIGRLITFELARRGARIIMACRNQETAKKTKEEVIEETKNDKLVIRKLDLSSLTSIRNFAKEIHETEEKIDILINNAGAYGLRNKKTEDGLNVLMQINHFGPFLLTNLLLDLVKKSAPSRIIFTSSVVNIFAKLDFDNLNFDKHHQYFRVYATSKLCNIMTANYLAKKLEGTGVTVNSLHPGMVKTEIFGNFYNFTGFMSPVFKFFIDFLSKVSGYFYKSTFYFRMNKIPYLNTVFIFINKYARY
ncbi:retinol dehydrogenase 13 [Nilaparvata lugens]|uniref:retinol dehydrogenase 13 n=1 Tax=Nilaparvata lugens TaxID=108931 RepID=UPI00193D1DA6|nr:retinol dehydrogenase 13 [Nilaparvata lugens]